MSARDQTAHLKVYTTPEIVARYAGMDSLSACEQRLFDTYLHPGQTVLDLGVGGGRTTPYLSRQASHYVGVDYSEEMIDACRSKFPHLQFNVADASGLSQFADASFDSVVSHTTELTAYRGRNEKGACANVIAFSKQAGSTSSHHTTRALCFLIGDGTGIACESCPAK